MRPANMVTSVADVLAGIAISGAFSFSLSKIWPAVILLCAATACLYAGGIVYNDVYDAGLDSVERPERPIPSGAVTINEARMLGFLLLLTGIILAGIVGTPSGLLAIGISIFALVYDKWGKHNALFGPLNMGLCRGLNLLLGISILLTSLQSWYLLGLIPVIYIYSITMISRGEVYGGNSKNLYVGAILYLIVISAILYFANLNNSLFWSLIFLVPFALMIFIPLAKAIREPIGKNIGGAVKAGVIALILMDAAWAITFSTLYPALVIACLLPISLWLSKLFAVT
jgi:4-hydroxybenzoate polyprenyltransferase